jgi:hypothetical protein
MSIIADRGLFVRLLVQSGKFESPEAEALVDALDAATREPATRADLAKLEGEMALLGQRMDAMGVRLDGRIDALGDRLLVRLGGLTIAVAGALFAALRLT